MNSLTASISSDIDEHSSSKNNQAKDNRYRPMPVWRHGRCVLMTGLILCGLVHALIALGFSFAVAEMFRDLRASGASPWLENVGLYAAVILAAVLITVLTRMAERELAERVGQSYVIAMRTRLYDHMLHVALTRAQRFSGGSKMLRFVTDLNGLQRWVSFGLARMLVALTMLTVILTVLFWLSASLALVIAISLGVGLVLSALTVLDLPVAVRRVRKYRARMAATVNDRIATVATIQACDQRRRELKRVEKQSQELRQPLIYRARIIGAVRGALEGTALMTSAMALLWGAFLVQANQLTVADVVALAILVGLLAQPLRDFARVIEYWNDWRVSHEKIARFFTQPTERKEVKIRHLPEGPGLLEIKSVAIEGIVEPFSATIRPGEKVLLRGANGAGKSTLLYTLAGLISPSGGCVLIDGHNVHRRRCLRGRGGIAIVSPDLGLMRGSVLRNLTYGFTQAKDDDIRQTLRLCGLETWLDSLPKGLHTRVAEGGKNLSLGQRQLLLLARALITRPRLLLLDEFDAHLDQETKARIEAVLADYPGAIIRVSHAPIDTRTFAKVWQLMDQRIIASDRV